MHPLCQLGLLDQLTPTMADLEDYCPQTATIQRYQLSTGKWRIELVIRTFAITSSLAMVLIAMSLAVQGMCLSIILLSGPAGLSILWNITKATYVAKSVDHRSSHPVAAVALDLVLCVGFLVVSSMILVSYRAATINNRQGRTDVPAGSYGRSIAEGALMIING